MFARHRAVEPGLSAAEPRGRASRVIYPFSTKASTNSDRVIQDCLMNKRKQSVVVLAVILSIFSCTGEAGRRSGKPEDNTIQPQAGAAQLTSTSSTARPKTPGKLALLVGI